MMHELLPITKILFRIPMSNCLTLEPYREVNKFIKIPDRRAKNVYEMPNPSLGHEKTEYEGNVISILLEATTMKTIIFKTWG